jgi:hypothetical protein
MDSNHQTKALQTFPLPFGFRAPGKFVYASIFFRVLLPQSWVRPFVRDQNRGKHYWSSRLPFTAWLWSRTDTSLCNPLSWSEEEHRPKPRDPK